MIKLDRQGIWKGLVVALLGLGTVSIPGFASPAPPDTFELKAKADGLLRQGLNEEAIRAYKTVLERDPRFANAHFNLAIAHYLVRNPAKAIEHLQAFLELQPGDPEALYNLGCLKVRQGDFDKAHDCFLEARTGILDPYLSKKIAEALHFLEDLRSETPQNQELLQFLITA